MYVNASVYVYSDAHTHTYVFMCVYIYTYIHIYTSVHVHMHLHVYIAYDALAPTLEQHSKRHRNHQIPKWSGGSGAQGLGLSV